jgi:Glycosyltransferase family 28 N-terminal domain
MREKRKTMRVLVSSAGTRGDAQPVLALALEVRKLGHEVRLCVPPKSPIRYRFVCLRHTTNSRTITSDACTDA